jgi:hypothetical protein
MESEKPSAAVGENSGENNKLRKELDCEYTQCFESWRFFLKLRAGLAVISFSIMAVLLYFYFSKGKDGSLPSYQLRFVIFVLGSLYTVAIMIIEGRNRQMYRACLDRARAIELTDEKLPDFPYEGSLQKMWVCTKHFLRGKVHTLEAKEHNLATLLISTPRHFLAWMTGGIYLLYIGMLVIWILLFFGTTLRSLVRLLFGGSSTGPVFF